ELLRSVIAPLHPALSEPELDRLAKALSLVFGVEALVILKDIWNAGQEETREVALWSARALVRAAVMEASQAKAGGRRQSGPTN
ncbi:MAG: TetR/AcrR family transcriptional regulator, partial [Mesorhizobium sp.]|nr:TetR/AcrR family transcriptional regulator [Mesorhizobium sp.]